MISVVIPTSKEDIFNAWELASTLNAHEVIVELGGRNPAESRNIGAKKARGDELLFLDSDVRLPPNTDLTHLRDFGWEMATCYFFGNENSGLFDPLIMLYQNWVAELGLPTGFFGGYMYMTRRVFERVGGFRDVPCEDIEFAHRAWLLGIKIGVHPIKVIHTRPFHWRNVVGSLITKDNKVWGLP